MGEQVMTRANKEIPLRVRLTETEDARLMSAANKVGLSRSEYTRWAIENSTTQVLGVHANGQPVTSTAPLASTPKKQKRAPAPPQPEIAVVEVPAEPEVVPDLATAMGIPMFANEAGFTPKPVPFDDSDWE